MANWCRGDIKIQGFHKDVIRFLDEVIINNNDVVKEYTEKDNFKIKAKDRAWYNGFGNMYSYELNVFGCFVNGEIYSRWDFEIDKIQKISDKYSLDITIIASECMCELFQIIRVINGAIEVNYVGKDKALTYSMDMLEEE